MLTAATGSDTCEGDSAYFFIQYKCIQSDEMLETKYNQGTIVGCLSLLVVGLYIACLHWLKRSSKLVFLDWDMSNITLGDYSIEYKISKESYDWFMENVFRPNDEPKGLSIGESFEAYLVQEIEGKLNDLLKQKRQDDPESI